MPLTVSSPTILNIPDSVEFEKLEKLLAYTDEKVVFEYRKLKNNRWLREKDPSKYRASLLALQKEQEKNLAFKSGSKVWTYSGLAGRLAKELGLSVINEVSYPEEGFVPWNKEPRKEARPYQTEAFEALLKAKHGAVQIGTGLGKSFIILMLAKHLALKTVILTPSVSIANQIVQEFTAAFGKKHVGSYFGGKKEYHKLFTVAVGASLTRVEKGTDAWTQLSETKVFIADESHMTPASTLANVCFGVVANAPYRLFFSGTQIRGDGLGIVLEGIIGPIVYEMTVREGVDQGWLARPLFRMLNTESYEECGSSDPNELTRAHLFYNPLVNEKAAQLANNLVLRKGYPVLILVEEIEQFLHLLPHLKVEVGFAHGGAADKLPPEYRKSDPQTLVERFNAKELPVLVGTSCISTGTDIRENRATIYLMGGKSEVQVRQAVGRNTRLSEGKTECLHFDFDVRNVEAVHRHAEARRAIYEDIYGPVKELGV